MDNYTGRVLNELILNAAHLWTEEANVGAGDCRIHAQI